jgi:hypothetical protein
MKSLFAERDCVPILLTLGTVVRILIRFMQTSPYYKRPYIYGLLAQKCKQSFNLAVEVA